VFNGTQNRAKSCLMQNIVNSCTGFFAVAKTSNVAFKKFKKRVAKKSLYIFLPARRKIIKAAHFIAHAQ
jgi:hypothetical protein